MPPKYVCIHGHFYQPPRENPFTGVVEDQPTAAPYANWNQRIDAECYEPNSKARILGPDGTEERRLNNYSWISSDWGPTLLQWLEGSSPQTYTAVIESDGASARRFGGHGSSIAHCYNHTILPLSNGRDKRTQIVWGIADFEHRFGRAPEGMWLPETAVDLESLDIMAGEGIKFTILAPHQAGTASIDTRWPYRVELPSGREIAVFFYNGTLSQEIAFNGLLEDGVALAHRLADIPVDEAGAVLSHVATDGETYGHHHRFGEMALAKALVTLDSMEEVMVTNYAQFLDLRPPTATVEVVENTSWSCAHGVERWRSDCGCATGGHQPGDQEWRHHLRQALDLLRDTLIPEYEQRGSDVFHDPWGARDHYIEVLLGGSSEEFLRRHQREDLDEAKAKLAIDLLEIQHRAMLMYTSCGWFFDDIGRIEAIFVLRQAGRVIDLTRQTLGMDLEPQFLDVLGKARSNEGGRNGREIYEEAVSPYLKM